MELAGASVWDKHRRAGTIEWFPRALEEGLIAVCDMVVMEVLSSARDPADFEALEDALGHCPWLHIEVEDWDGARAVYRSLAARPLHHRSVKIPDLLIAAVAERHGLTVVHYDRDYERITDVTSRPTRWAAPRGSL